MYSSSTKVYVAGGWFNPQQLEAVKEVENFVDSWFDNNFKPRVANLGVVGCDWAEVFQANIDHLDSADLVIASTMDKDMGTLWECGYAYAKGIPVVYYIPGIDKVNLMLAMSGKVARDVQELFEIVMKGKDTGEVYGIE